VTGALLHTGASFAQWLEGPADAVEAIMGSILIDRRHSAVHIVRRTPLAARRFPDWSMVLVGHEAETEARLQRLRAAATEPGLDAGIEALLAAMARDAGARASPSTGSGRTEV